ncbi:MAG: hypothetical protein IK115_11775 [Lachnospiraceae bacterium]|nr:hypothetical protein [Lachnospiraceae bacterium]
MACFLVSAAEAVIVKSAEKVAEKKEVQSEGKSGHAAATKLPFSVKLRWLSRLLVGGAILLAFEHVWHGEVVPWFPFLTAMADPGDAAEMFHEMATVGVAMAVLVTVVWIGMCIVADKIVARASHGQEVEA